MKVQTRRFKLQTANTKNNWTAYYSVVEKDMEVKQFNLLLNLLFCIENDAQVLSMNTFHEQLASKKKRKKKRRL